MTTYLPVCACHGKPFRPIVLAPNEMLIKNSGSDVGIQQYKLTCVKSRDLPRESWYQKSDDQNKRQAWAYAASAKEFGERINMTNRTRENIRVEKTYHHAAIKCNASACHDAAPNWLHIVSIEVLA